MAKVEVRPQSWGTRVLFHCPGCRGGHSVDVRADGGRPSWTFNGDVEKPTFAPSVHYPGRCHFFVTGGRVQFLGDSAHELAGQTVDLPDV